jgi:hypothetical protein
VPTASTARAIRACVLGIALAVVATTVPAGLAEAVDDGSGRSLLLSSYQAAYADYSAATSLSDELSDGDRKVVDAKVRSARSSLNKAKPLIERAKSSSSLRRARAAMVVESARAATMRRAVWQLHHTEKARALAKQRALADLSASTNGTMSADSYARAYDSGAAAASRIDAERAEAFAAMGSTSTPSSAGALSAATAYATGSTVVRAATGRTGVPGGCSVPSVDTNRWLGSVRQPGPQLWTTKAWEESARAKASTDAGLAKTRQRMLTSARTEMGIKRDVLNGPTWSYLPKRALAFGYLWRETGDANARTKLINEVQSVAIRGPKGSELQNAMVLEGLATGLELSDPSPATRKRIADNIAVRWLGPASCLLAERSRFVYGAYNIPLVTNTASALAGLAIAHDRPTTGAAVTAASLYTVRASLAVLSRDGGSPEGPEYWSFQTRYAAALYSTVRAVYGAKPPVALPDLSRSAFYLTNTRATNGQIFTHSDTADMLLRAGLPGWYGFDKSSRLGGGLLKQQAAVMTEPWQVWWWPRGATATPTPSTGIFRTTGVAALQVPAATAWLKGGKNTSVHAHLDLGTVGYQSKGVLWSIDPYKGKYTSTYFKPQTRWKVWETSTVSHSTLRLANLSNQPTGAGAAFSAFDAERRLAVLDMRSALRSGSAKRTVQLGTNGSLKITDAVRRTSAQAFAWQWTTDAGVSISGSTAKLTKSGKSVTVRFSGLPKGSKVRVVGAAGRKSADGRALRQLQVVTPKVKSLNLTAQFA